MSRGSRMTTKSFIRRAFPSVQAMAEYLDRTRKYCSGRLNSDELVFTETETRKLLEAVRFHNKTGLYLTEVDREINKKPERLAYEVAVFLICKGVGLFNSIECGLSAADKLGRSYPGIEADMTDFFNFGRSGS